MANLNSIFELKNCLKILEDFFKNKKINTTQLWINSIPFILGNKEIFKSSEYESIIVDYLKICQQMKLENVYSRRYKIYIWLLKRVNSIFMLKILGIIERSLLKLKYFIIKRW